MTKTTTTKAKSKPKRWGLIKNDAVILVYSDAGMDALINAMIKNFISPLRKGSIRDLHVTTERADHHLLHVHWESSAHNEGNQMHDFHKMLRTAMGDLDYKIVIETIRWQQTLCPKHGIDCRGNDDQ